MNKTCYNFMILCFCLVSAVVNSNGVKIKNNSEEVLLVSAVLAPYSKAENDTAKDFPVLMLLAGDKPVEGVKQSNEDSMKEDEITIGTKTKQTASVTESRNSRAKSDADTEPGLKSTPNNHKAADDEADINTNSSHEQPIYIQKLQ